MALSRGAGPGSLGRNTDATAKWDLMSMRGESKGLQEEHERAFSNWVKRARKRIKKKKKRKLGRQKKARVSEEWHGETSGWSREYGEEERWADEEYCRIVGISCSKYAANSRWVRYQLRIRYEMFKEACIGRLERDLFQLYERRMAEKRRYKEMRTRVSRLLEGRGGIELKAKGCKD